MADELSKLSPEQLNKLASTISEAKGLTDRQLDIIEKVLLGESKISESRISHLKQYFDLYSSCLDKIARKQSELDDVFLVLDSKAKHYMQNDAGGNGGSGGNNSPPNSGNGSNTPPSDNKKDRKNRSTIDDSDREGLFENFESEVTEFLANVTDYYRMEEGKRREALIEGSEKLAYTSEELNEHQRAATLEQLKEHAQLKNDLQKSMMDLDLLRYQQEADLDRQITGHRLSMMQEVINAELEAQTLMNKFAAEEAYASQNPDEFAELRARKDKAKQDKENLLALEKDKATLEQQRAEYIARAELKARRKNNGKLTADAEKQIRKEADEKFKADKKNLDKLKKERLKQEDEFARKQEKESIVNDLGVLTGKGNTLTDRWKALKSLTHDSKTGEKDGWKAVSAVILAVSDLATKLESKVDTIAEFKGDIDTRLQGSNSAKSKGSYWDQLVKDMTSIGAVNPFFRQETFAENIRKLVEMGISFDLKQRAFLMTIQNKIATTFDAADGTLLRLIRIQQEDSTAGRLGMESALNAFLNNMYETSEYLSQAASGVRSSLEEVQALMQGAEGTELEYQVQKWLGSLYSVGMSQSAVQSISDTLGQIAAGQIEGITNGGTGNLLVMAADEAGLSIADILTDGINSSDTNKLLQATVDYLAKLAKDSEENRVVQQQLANVFGVKASDLKAATNLASSNSSVYGNSLTYSNMIDQLASMAGSMAGRTSMTEMMTNLWENGQYTLAGSMASSPVSYFIYKMAKVVDEAAGGIDLPFINVMGFGVDLNTTVSDLMRVAAIGGGILGSLGPIISGLGNSFSGQAMLNQLGITSGSGLAVTPRGSGGGTGISSGSGGSVSGSGYVGNASGSDVKNSTIQEAEQSKKQQMIEAKEEEESNQVNTLNTTILKIYELLDDVAHGSDSFKVQVEGYGLTKSKNGNSVSSSKALGGVDALTGGFGGNSGGGSGSGGSASGSGGSGSGVNSSRVSGNISLGGWTTSS